MGKGQWDGEEAGGAASRAARLTGTEIYPGSGLRVAGRVSRARAAWRRSPVPGCGGLEHLAKGF